MTRFEPIEDQRSRLTAIPGGIELSIPSRRNYFIAAFMAFWLCCWAFGLVAVTHQLLHPTEHTPRLFLAAWLGGWILGGGFAILALSWMLAGRERVTVANDALTIRREVSALGWSRHYELSAVRNLRVVDNPLPTPFGFDRRDPFGLSSGPFVFDYGARSRTFGAGLDVAEARMLLSRMLAAKPALSISSEMNR
jgi:hypothetical protein